jgi:hypothetical protein
MAEAFGIIWYFLWSWEMIGWERVANGSTDVVPSSGKAEGIAWIF